VPQQLQDVLEDIRMGRLRVRTGDPDTTRAWDRLGRRILTGLVVSSATLGAVMSHTNGKESLATILAGAAGLWLLGHVARDFLSGSGQNRRN